MDQYVTGAAIKMLREKKKLTQRELAERINVSDKAVSKWETQKGLPDISLLEPLAAALDVSVAELLSGACIVNSNRRASLLHARFYCCPICGNVICAVGEGAFSCCGVTLPPLEAEEPDAGHLLTVTRSDGDDLVSLAHPMEKGHFITFIACLTADGAVIRKLYPEQAAEARFPAAASGVFYACCNRHGLFCVKAHGLYSTV